ncbi:hypothetical protein NDU88_007653 [Pleurodeles waltl]|uniref:Uncharacterized protein n=1 Tax=Pleurodeles waltl TaxID=8319 RepID=A0AAV7VR24_PLEWA|nr:hypothetical protein NDU88_007653 [Pleurodeles waltl]
MLLLDKNLDTNINRSYALSLLNSKKQIINSTSFGPLTEAKGIFLISLILGRVQDGSRRGCFLKCTASGLKLLHQLSLPGPPWCLRPGRGRPPEVEERVSRTQLYGHSGERVRRPRPREETVGRDAGRRSAGATLYVMVWRRLSTRSLRPAVSAGLEEAARGSPQQTASRQGPSAADRRSSTCLEGGSLMN